MADHPQDPPAEDHLEDRQAGHHRKYHRGTTSILRTTRKMTRRLPPRQKSRSRHPQGHLEMDRVPQGEDRELQRKVQINKIETIMSAAVAAKAQKELDIGEIGADNLGGMVSRASEETGQVGGPGDRQKRPACPLCSPALMKAGDPDLVRAGSWPRWRPLE